MVYSTYLGGADFDSGYGIAVDGAGSAYIAGDTYSGNLPTTPGALDTSFNGGIIDGYVTKLNPTGSALVYSTYVGGGDYDFAGAMALADTGEVYVSGYDIDQLPDQLRCLRLEPERLRRRIPTVAWGGGVVEYSTYIGGTGGEVEAALRSMRRARHI